MSGAMAWLWPAMANHLWQSTVFAMVVWGLALLLRRNPARVRYGLWLAASVKFLLPFSLLVSAGSYFARPRPVASVQPRIAVVADEMAEPLAELAAPVKAVRVPVVSSRRVRAESRRAAEVAAPEMASAAADSVMAAASAAMAATPGLWERVRGWWPQALAGVWFGGLVTVLAMWGLRWRRVGRAVRAAQALDGGRESAAMRRAAKAAGVRSAVPVLVSRETMEPGIFGVVRPILLWPEGLSARLEDEHIEAIAAHELEHARRHDNLTAALHMLVEALFWFFPVVWWMERRLVEERERACDEAVVERGGQAETYAESLLRACRFCVESPLVCVAGITGADLSKRVRAIMTLRLERMGVAKKIALAALALAVVAAPVVFGQVRGALRMSLHTPAARLAEVAARLVSPVAAAESNASATAGGQHELYSIGGSRVLRWWPISVSGDQGRTMDPEVIAFEPLVPPPGVFAGKLEMKGLALVGMTVDESGRPREVHVVRGLTPELNAGAVQAAEAMRFKPAMRDGKPVAFAMDVIADFDHVVTTLPLKDAPVESERQFRFFTENVAAADGQRYRLEQGAGDFDNAMPKLLGTTESLRFDAAENGVVLQWMPPGLARPAKGYCAASYVHNEIMGRVPVVKVEKPCEGAYATALQQALERLWIIWPQQVMEVTGANGRVGTAAVVNAGGRTFLVSGGNEMQTVMTNDGPVPLMTAQGYVVVTADGRLGATEGELQPLLAKMGMGQERGGNAGAQSGAGATPFEIVSLRPSRVISGDCGLGGVAFHPRNSSRPVLMKVSLPSPTCDPNAVVATPPPGGVTVTPEGLLRVAYGVQDDRIVNAPAWMMGERYDLKMQAKTTDRSELARVAGDPVLLAEQRAVFEPFLEEHFGLKTHREVRQMPVYALEVAPGGVKLQASRANAETSREEGGEIVGQGFSMAGLAQMLSAKQGWTVLDRTGLGGRYDFKLGRTAEDRDMGLQGESAAVAANRLQQRLAINGPLQQLGLREVVVSAPVEVVVIDRIERPAVFEAQAAMQVQGGGALAQMKDHRLVVMFFDLSSMTAEDCGRAVDAARRYVSGQMQPTDMVSLASLGTSLNMDQDFTSDKAALLRGLEKYRGEKSAGGRADARRSLAAVKTVAASLQKKVIAPEKEKQLYEEGVISKEAYEQVMVSNQHKSMFYFTGEPPRQSAGDAGWRSATDAAAKADMAIYVVDARGLQATAGGGAAPGDLKAGPAAGLMILSDTQGVDFGPYLRELHDLIQRRWVAGLPAEIAPPSSVAGVTGIRFKVLPDGSLSGTTLETPSGNAGLDTAAWTAITGLGKFPALPKEFHGPVLEMRVGFYVNMKPGSGGTAELMSGAPVARRSFPVPTCDPHAADCGIGEN